MNTLAPFLAGGTIDMFRNTPSISDYYRNVLDRVRTKILQESDSAIVGTPSEELTEYYYSAHALQPPALDPERQETIEHRKKVRVVPAHRRDALYRSEGDLQFEFESIILTIPVLPNEHIEGLQQLGTSTSSLNWSPREFICHAEAIVATVEIKGYGFNFSDEDVAGRVQAARARVRQWLEWARADVERENRVLRQAIQSFIEERQKKIREDAERMAVLTKKVNIPLRRKEGEAATRIRVDRRPIVTRVKPQPEAPEEYILDRQKVLDILQVIDNQCRQMERTPQTYKSSREEDLRNIILVGLNSLFESRATGETFSVRGKTDIHLNIDKGNILVAECKMWVGEEMFRGAIEQLLGYLSWRQNYGIVIMFSRNKGFSSVLKQVEPVVTSHLSYLGDFKSVADTHFESCHALPQDREKQVELHHLFYDLHVSET